MYNTIILSGGASRGYYQLGCIDANLSKMKDTTRYVGTSVGSIIALLIICGFTTTEIMDLSLTVEVKYPRGRRWLDWFNGIRLPFMKPLAPWMEMAMGMLHNNGMMKDNPYITMAHKVLMDKYGKIPTMKELYDNTGKELICATTRTTTYETVYVTYTSHPDLSVITAVDMSSRVPILFTPIRYDGHLYVDGGLTDHIPLSMASGSTLAILTHDEPMDKNEDISIFNYLWSLFNSATKNRYIHIDNNVTLYRFSKLGGGMTSTREEAMKMYLSGYVASPEEEDSNGCRYGQYNQGNNSLILGNEDDGKNDKNNANDNGSNDS